MATSDGKNHQIDGSSSRIYGSSGSLFEGGRHFEGLRYLTLGRRQMKASYCGKWNLVPVRGSKRLNGKRCPGMVIVRNKG